MKNNNYRKFLTIVILVFINSVRSQSVFEYNKSNDIDFKIYSTDENILRKLNNSSSIDLSTPEQLARNYFFATSNQMLSKLYFDKNEFEPQEESGFENIKNTSSEDMFLQLLHKMTYSFQENERCYVMFIVRIKGIDFPFPTLLSLIKQEGNWYIDKRPNQQKVRDCLMMFKPCVLSNLIQGETDDEDIQFVINNSRSNERGIDFVKLFGELVRIQENEELSKKLTMSQNMDCSNIEYKMEVEGTDYLTAVYDDAKIQKFKSQNAALVSQLKQNNDSIVLTSRLDINYSNKLYSFVKFERIKNNGDILKEVVRIDNNGNPAKPVQISFFYSRI